MIIENCFTRICYYHPKEYRNTREKNYWNMDIARSYVTRRECETKSRMQKNAESASGLRSSRYIRTFIQRRLAIPWRIINRRDIDAAPPLSRDRLPLSTRVSVEFRSPFCFAQGRCGWSIWVSREHQDYPDPAALRAFVFLRRVLDCSRVANCEPLAWRVVAGMFRRNRYAGVHNDPIASQRSGDYLTMTRDKAPCIKANEGDANRPQTVDIEEEHSTCSSFIPRSNLVV